MYTVKRYDAHLWGIWDNDADSWVNEYDEYTKQDEPLLFSHRKYAHLWVSEEIHGVMHN